MRAFKDSSVGQNIAEGLAVFLLLFPIFAIWVVAKRVGKYNSGFVFATAVYTFIPLGMLGLLLPISRMLDSFWNNILGTLLVSSWLFALGYAIWKTPNMNANS
jgi:hypothetical protein